MVIVRLPKVCKATCRTGYEKGTEIMRQLLKMGAASACYIVEIGGFEAEYEGLICGDEFLRDVEKDSEY